MPKVGPFFITNSKQIVSSSTELENARQINKLFDSNVEHWKLFDKIPEKESRFDSDDYINVPRGRVIYDNTKQKSIIYIDECFKNDTEVINKILKRFKIKLKDQLLDYEILTDNHYQCVNCMIDSWDD